MSSRAYGHTVRYKPEKARAKGNKAAAATVASGGSLAGLMAWARTAFGGSLPWPPEADAGLVVLGVTIANWGMAWFANRRKHK